MINDGGLAPLQAAANFRMGEEATEQDNIRA